MAAAELAQSLGLQFSLRQLTAEEAGPALASGQVDLVLGERVGVEVAAAVPGAQLAWQGTGYAVRPKAVIRSDTRMQRATRAPPRVHGAGRDRAQAQARAWGPRCAPIACLPMRWWRCEEAIATWASSTTRCGSR